MDDDDNPDFPPCDGCGGSFYYGDLTDGLCADCLEDDDDA